ncbi:hypothetical protein BGZ63DRAFT_348773 [Mariannaea sp. PMI_226]|nr:hypothetical protein BGZ63DRAFT_348773 [Mariannaea sp. PMI_226]
MPVSLQTSWQLQNAAGEPSAIIRARNLQTIIQGPQDAWGRPGRPQPALVSAEVSLAQPFGSSSSGDVVAPDTVHYGLLSKSILATLARLETRAGKGDAATLHGVVDGIWTDLTGLDVTGAQVHGTENKAFLNLSYIRCLTVSVVLTKASLLGSGIGLTASAVFQDSIVQSRGLSLQLQGLRVPTLIGVNDNERKAKQIVVANIGVEKYSNEKDGYVPLEAIVVDAMMSSSFETLEALATYLASHITEHIASSGADSPDSSGWHLQIGLEKPTAVPLADAACVEFRTSTQSFMKK